MIYEEVLLYHYPIFNKNYKNKINDGESICQHIIENDNKNKKYDQLDDSVEYSEFII